jgi:hypothetical protein
MENTQRLKQLEKKFGGLGKAARVAEVSPVTWWRWRESKSPLKGRSKLCVEKLETMEPANGH